jgi:hypothetical protein
MNIEELSLKVEGFLGRLRETTHSPEEQELLLAAIDALRFISSTGQSYDFEDYRKSIDAHAPPQVCATFSTREEADAWLKDHPSPPHLAYVLIAGEYHIVLYLRERNHRTLSPHPALTYHLQEMQHARLPPEVATFNTREEADAWLDKQPEPPAQAVIRVAGEDYLAVYHRNVNHRAIYPFPKATKG